MEQFERLTLLINDEGLQKLKKARVALFGVGGVGGMVLETLARSGIGSITIFDHDTINVTNINRQVIALHSNINKLKVEEAKLRVLDINPNIIINTNNQFIDKDNIDTIDFRQFDYIIDAIDTISTKILLVEKAVTYQLPIISSMGTGNKFLPSELKIIDLSKTSICPLAKVMRYELKKRGIIHVSVLASSENPQKPLKEIYNDQNKLVVASTSMVPPTGGILIASCVINNILGIENNIKVPVKKCGE